MPPSLESRTARFVLALMHLGPGPAAVTYGGVRVGEDDLGHSFPGCPQISLCYLSQQLDCSLPPLTAHQPLPQPELVRNVLVKTVLGKTLIICDKDFFQECINPSNAFSPKVS